LTGLTKFTVSAADNPTLTHSDPANWWTHDVGDEESEEEEDTKMVASTNTSTPANPAVTPAVTTESPRSVEMKRLGLPTVW